MMIGFVQLGTSRGMLLMTIGSRKITPPRMLRMVPLGERYIRLSPNSSTRASSGVIVAHFTPTPYCLIALAASTVIWSSVASRDSIPRSKYFSSTSRYGRISWSLMKDQMMRVISSPSSSTTGFVTEIFAMGPRLYDAGRVGDLLPSAPAGLARLGPLAAFAGLLLLWRHLPHRQRAVLDLLLDEVELGLALLVSPLAWRLRRHGLKSIPRCGGAKSGRLLA